MLDYPKNYKYPGLKFNHLNLHCILPEKEVFVTDTSILHMCQQKKEGWGILKRCTTNFIHT